jgi:hypothetical protein
MTPERLKCAEVCTAESSIARQRLAMHVFAATDRLVESKTLLPKLTHFSMDMWIHGDRLGTERVPVSADKQPTFSMVTGDYYKWPCRDERRDFLFIICDSLVSRSWESSEISSWVFSCGAENPLLLVTEPRTRDTLCFDEHIIQICVWISAIYYTENISRLEHRKFSWCAQIIRTSVSLGYRLSFCYYKAEQMYPVHGTYK